MTSKAHGAIYPNQFQAVLVGQAAEKRDTLLADSIAQMLTAEPWYREFRKSDRGKPDGHDLIVMATSKAGRVTFTYLRNGERAGLQTGFVNRIGLKLLFSGRWFQQSKMDGAGRFETGRPWEFSPGDDTTDGGARYVDKGAFIYWGTGSESAMKFSNGRDLNLRDQIIAHESWLKRAGD